MLVSRAARAVCLALVASSILPACAPDGSFGKPVVWPQAARLGDTVAMAIDSNDVETFGALYERYDLSAENVTVALKQGTTTLATIAPRVVFDGLSAPTSVRNLTRSGPFLTIVVFDLPASLGIALPATTSVELRVDGVAVFPAITGTLDLLGTGGSAQAFRADSDPATLVPQPTLRLHGRAGDGESGFDPAWPAIGSIEFTLEYPEAAVSAPDVHPATEASRALAFASTDDPPGTVRIFVTDPRGFTLSSTPGYPGGNRVGEGPLLDVTFAKAPGEGFAAADFTIRDLVVRDTDGVLLGPTGDPPGTDHTAFFARIPRQHEPE